MPMTELRGVEWRAQRLERDRLGESEQWKTLIKEEGADPRPRLAGLKLRVRLD